MNSIEQEECVITGNINEKNDNLLLTDTIKGKMSGIYKIVNKTNGKYYVGSSNDLKGRISDHKYTLNKNTHANPHLQSSWNKYGKDNFEFVIVEYTSQEKLVEQKYLDIAKTEQYKCYNSSFIVDYPPKLSPEKEFIRRKKISNAIRSGWNENLKNLHSQITTEYFKNKENRKKTSESVKMAMSNPLIIEKLRQSKRDKAIYQFKNLKTNETFCGTKFDFRMKYGLNHYSVDSVIYGKRKSIKKWILNGLCK